MAACLHMHMLRATKIINGWACHSVLPCSRDCSCAGERSAKFIFLHRAVLLKTATCTVSGPRYQAADLAGDQEP